VKEESKQVYDRRRKSIGAAIIEKKKWRKKSDVRGKTAWERKNLLSFAKVGRWGQLKEPKSKGGAFWGRRRALLSSRSKSGKDPLIRHHLKKKRNRGTKGRERKIDHQGGGQFTVNMGENSRFRIEKVFLKKRLATGLWARKGKDYFVRSEAKRVGSVWLAEGLANKKKCFTAGTLEVQKKRGGGRGGLSPRGKFPRRKRVRGRDELSFLRGRGSERVSLPERMIEVSVSRLLGERKGAGVGMGLNRLPFKEPSVWDRKGVILVGEGRGFLWAIVGGGGRKETFLGEK